MKNLYIITLPNTGYPIHSIHSSRKKADEEFEKLVADLKPKHDHKVSAVIVRQVAVGDKFVRIEKYSLRY